MKYQPVENYGVIGDLSTAALVGQDGSIDFMCFPRFDSPTIFAISTAWILDYKLSENEYGWKVLTLTRSGLFQQ